MTLFVLYFMGPDHQGHVVGQFMGVYSSQARAARAVERLQSLPWFSHYPKGFQVEAVQLDEEVDHSTFGSPPPNNLIPPE